MPQLIDRSGAIADRIAVVRNCAALADLPEPQRRALMLAYFGGYSQSEIATMTGIPLGTVKTRTLAALRRLRSVLDDAHVHGPVPDGEGV